MHGRTETLTAAPGGALETSAASRSCDRPTDGLLRLFPAVRQRLPDWRAPCSSVPRPSLEVPTLPSLLSFSSASHFLPLWLLTSDFSLFLFLFLFFSSLALFFSTGPFSSRSLSLRRSFLVDSTRWSPLSGGFTPLSGGSSPGLSFTLFGLSNRDRVIGIEVVTRSQLSK